MVFYRAFIERVSTKLQESTLGILNIENKALRVHILEKFSETIGLNNSENFLATPLFEPTFGWRSGTVEFQDLAPNLFDEKLIDVLDNAKTYKFSKNAKPYIHQLVAWEALTDRTPKSVIVTSGTGSGKTECFMLPILNDLISELKSKNNQQLNGVRALFLYPLNALINSQQERLDAWTRPFGDKIRFCLYNGDTEEFAASVSKDQDENPNKVLSRQTLRNKPAPLLLTNATMLEYMLIRQVDAPIINISKQEQSLRWIILDEAHTYIGSQAAEIALLLRRVILAFGKRPEEVRFVATSATIAGENAKEELQKFLAKLAGVPIDHVVVVTGEKDWEKFSEDIDEQASFSYQEIRSIDPGEKYSKKRFEALKMHPISRSIRDFILNSQDGPKDINELVKVCQKYLDHKNDIDAQQIEVLNWIDLMTDTYGGKTQEAFLKVRTHFFQRIINGLWSCIDPNCCEKSQVLKDGEWPFGNVYTLQRDQCNCGAPIFEVVLCKDCGAPYLLAEENSDDHTLHQKSYQFIDEFTLSNEWNDHNNEGEINVEDEVEILNNGSKVDRLLAPGNSSNDEYIPQYVNIEECKIGDIQDDRSVEVNIPLDERYPSCIHCDAKASKRNGYLFYRKNYLGAPTYVKNVIPTILEYCPNIEEKDTDVPVNELPALGRKLITFTDSRQNTARHTLNMQQEAERSKLRGSVFKILTQHELRNDSFSVTDDDIEKCVARKVNEIESLGFIVDDNKYHEIKELCKNELDASRKTDVYLSWKELTEEISKGRDFQVNTGAIYQSNLDANHALFLEYSEQDLAELLMTREFLRRPKYGNTLETLGFVDVSYKDVDKITNVPKYWEDQVITNGVNKGKKLTVQDWRDFIRFCLDYVVRDGLAVYVHRKIVRWIGQKLHTSYLLPHGSDITKKRYWWPRISDNSTSLSRLPKAICYVTGLDPRVNRGLINSWLDDAWNCLVNTIRALEKIDGNYFLRLDNLKFSLAKKGIICPITNKVLVNTFQGITPFLPNKLDSNFNYIGEEIVLPEYTSLEADTLDQVRMLIAENKTIPLLRARGIWTDLSDEIVEGGFYYRVAEHSAQQASKLLDRYVEEFKEGKINVLNCSTTMEMGVDIGGISAVVMNNVPPHPANYLQRAGRAGRRNESRSFAYTLCQSNPHNMRVFNDPKWAFTTPIATPNITLSSEKIVQRHVNALLLAIFLNEIHPVEKNAINLNAYWFYTGVEAESSPCDRFSNFIVGDAISYKSQISRLVQGTVLETESIENLLNVTRSHNNQLRDKWLKTFNNMNEKYNSAEEGPYKIALAMEINHHKKSYLLSNLAMHSFIPNYGFPINLASLDIFNIDEYKKDKQNYNRLTRTFDEKDNKKFEKLYKNNNPTRELNRALQEYTPGASVVINGAIYKSAGINLDCYGGKKDEIQLDTLWRCRECGASGIVEKIYSQNKNIICSECGNYKLERSVILKPTGFKVDFFEAKSNDTSIQPYIKSKPPIVMLNNNEDVSLPNLDCGHIRFGDEGMIIYQSSGEYDRGFAICFKCGRGESMLRDGIIPEQFEVGKTHQPLNSKSFKEYKQERCSNENVKENIILGYYVPTDVFELYLKNPLTSEWLTDPVIAYTIGLAIRDLFAAELGIASKEMGIEVKKAQDPVLKANRMVIQIYDSVSGGAGFVTTAVLSLSNILKKLEKKLDCSNNCLKACPHCLVGSDNFAENYEIDRLKALEWLHEIDFFGRLRYSEIDSAYRYMPYKPKEFVRIACSEMKQSSQDNARITIFFPKYDYFTLDNPDFIYQVKQWILMNYDVQIAIPEDINLDESARARLKFFENFGVKLKYYINSDFSEQNLYLALLIDSEKDIDKNIALFTDNVEMTHPDQSWLATDQNTRWVSSRNIDIQLLELNTDNWLSEKNISEKQGNYIFLLEKAFSMDLAGFSMYFRDKFEAEYPMLLSAIANNEILSISYTDRYLRSPWYYLLLVMVIRSLVGDKKIDKLIIRTTAIENMNKPMSYSHKIAITDNWPAHIELSKLSAILFTGIFNIKNYIYDDKEKNRELQHSRELVIELKNGMQFKLFFDQGMGFWSPWYKRGLNDKWIDISQDKESIINSLIGKISSIMITTPEHWESFIAIKEIPN